jgi:hypothetical protein
MESCKLKFISFFLILVSLLLCATLEADAKCMIQIGDRYFRVPNSSCADVHECNPEIRCVDLPISFVEPNSSTVVYMVAGGVKYLLASDEAQAKFEAVFKDKILHKMPIPTVHLERELKPIIAKNGIISKAGIAKIAKEFGVQVKEPLAKSQPDLTRQKLGVDAKPAEAAQDARPRPPIDPAPAKQQAGLTVQKILIPSNDPGKFNLRIDGVVKATAVGNNGTTGIVNVTVGTHNVTETAGSGPGLVNYTTVIGGDCSTTGVVTLAAEQSKTCTVTNTRRTLGPLTEASAQLEGAAIHAFPEVTHGSWTQGYGTYSFTVCATGTTGTPCNINGAPGQSIPITIETWGGGGGGGGGETGNTCCGGAGGGGGGGGGYAKTTITAVVPSTYFVFVGHGGQGGAGGVVNGVYGQHTDVRLGNNLNGLLVLAAEGGGGGAHAQGNMGGGTSMPGGVGGKGTINNWAGTAGYNGGSGSTCNGHAGGLGGAGGGPGRTGPGYINDGGNGGHGGYYHHVVSPTCTAHGQDYELSDGITGGNGKVTFVW